MKITICGSNFFYDNMARVKNELKSLGHEVDLPPAQQPDADGNMISSTEFHNVRHTAGDDEEWVWNAKEKFMHEHLTKVVWSDAILVLNYDKNDIPNYIGGNTFLEMGVAFHLGKKIFLLNPIPHIAYREEILAMKPKIIDGEITAIQL